MKLGCLLSFVCALSVPSWTFAASDFSDCVKRCEASEFGKGNPKCPYMCDDFSRAPKKRAKAGPGDANAKEEAERAPASTLSPASAASAASSGTAPGHVDLR